MTLARSDKTVGDMLFKIRKVSIVIVLNLLICKNGMFVLFNKPS